jgi:endonuclease YncB( thermonuclease family)
MQLVLALMLLQVDCRDPAPSRASVDYWPYIEKCGCSRASVPPPASLDYGRWLQVCRRSPAADEQGSTAAPAMPAESGAALPCRTRPLGPQVRSYRQRTEALSGSRSDLVQVTSVVDGESFDASRAGGSVTIGVDGIDAPETEQPCHREAKRALSELLLGETVALDTCDYGRRGRTLCHVTVRGLDVAKVLVSEGLVWPLPNTSEDLLAGHEEARRLSLGIFSGPRPIPPWEWRQP